MRALMLTYCSVSMELGRALPPPVEFEPEEAHEARKRKKRLAWRITGVWFWTAGAGRGALGTN
jgi:hypothetical protein